MSWLLTDLSSTCTMVRQITLTEPIPQRAELIKLAAPRMKIITFDNALKRKLEEGK